MPRGFSTQPVRLSVCVCSRLGGAVSRTLNRLQMWPFGRRGAELETDFEEAPPLLRPATIEELFRIDREAFHIAVDQISNSSGPRWCGPDLANARTLRPQH